MDAKKTLIGSTLTVILVFALGAMAIASDIMFYVGGFAPGWYEEERMTKDVEKIIDECGGLFKDIQVFGDDKIDEMGKWADANTGDGEFDIIWLNGEMPSSLYPVENKSPDDSRIENWLDDGNMIINPSCYFAWCNFETGVKIRNTDTGAAMILDLGENIIESADNTGMTVTDTGKKFMPSLGNECVSDRPVNLDALADPWEAAAIFASVSGKEDQAGLVDPVLLHNTETDGYLAIISQATLANMVDIGQACVEFINNWVVGEKELLAVEPAGKLSATWGKIKCE